MSAVEDSKGPRAAPATRLLVAQSLEPMQRLAGETPISVSPIIRAAAVNRHANGAAQSERRQTDPCNRHHVGCTRRFP
jgi:hypothetical protein